MSAAGWLSLAMTHVHGVGVQRRLRRPLTPLTVPVVSVGNIAFGGRAKTPLVAAVAQAAIAEGLRPAVLTRGYLRGGSRISVAIGRSSDEAVWRAPVQLGATLVPAHEAAPQIGDEPAWLAGCLPGVPIGVGADRVAAAEAVLAGSAVDFFLLDDGFQHPLPRRVDLVVVQPGDGRAGRWGREAAGALSRADRVLTLGEGRDLQRLPGRLRDLRTGAVVHDRPRVDVLVGVAEPGSVAETAAAAGLVISRSISLGDHRAPGPLRRRTLELSPGAVWLLTEKDAVGWAAAAPPPGRALVLGCTLRGADTAWSEVRRGLDRA